MRLLFVVMICLLDEKLLYQYNNRHSASQRNATSIVYFLGFIILASKMSINI